jgi:uncharacterized integral membrane protein
MSSSGEDFDRSPSALKGSVPHKLWAIDDGGAELFSYKDILATSGPVAISPESPVAGTPTTVPVNPITGRAFNVTFTWERPNKATSFTYDLWIGLDPDFVEKAARITHTSSSSQPDLTVGPTVETVANRTYRLEFMPGTTYYWKVRVATDGPVRSPWNYERVGPRSFTIEPSAAMVPEILSPANGATGLSLMPSFSWEPVTDTTQYQFVLADNVALSAPIVNVQTQATGYALATELEYGKTYYWAVRAMSPVEGGFSAIANFTIKEKAVEPAPPLVVKEMPAPQITVQTPPPPPDIVIPPAPTPPAPVAPAYIWAVIIIGAILVILLVVLIVRTRRPV